MALWDDRLEERQAQYERDVGELNQRMIDVVMKATGAKGAILTSQKVVEKKEEEAREQWDRNEREKKDTQKDGHDESGTYTGRVARDHRLSWEAKEEMRNVEADMKVNQKADYRDDRVRRGEEPEVKVYYFTNMEDRIVQTEQKHEWTKGLKWRLDKERGFTNEQIMNVGKVVLEKDFEGTAEKPYLSVLDCWTEIFLSAENPPFDKSGDDGEKRRTNPKYDGHAGRNQNPPWTMGTKPEYVTRSPKGTKKSIWFEPRATQKTSRNDGTMVWYTPNAYNAGVRNSNWPNGSPKWRDSRICICVRGFEKTISENAYIRQIKEFNVGTVRAVYFPRDEKTWEPMAYFFVQFETKQEAWMVADKLHGRRVDHGSRTLDVEWSTVEIDMNYI